MTLFEKQVIKQTINIKEMAMRKSFKGRISNEQIWDVDVAILRILKTLLSGTNDDVLTALDELLDAIHRR